MFIMGALSSIVSILEHPVENNVDMVIDIKRIELRIRI